MIDNIDSEILSHLRNDARLTNRELGKLVGLSANAAGARVQRLRERGVITGFHIAIDHEKLGRPMEASVDVWIDDGNSLDMQAVFAEVVAHDERVVECFHLTGPLDFRIRARVSSAADLNDLLRHLKAKGGVRQTDSRLILEHFPTASG